MSSVELTNDDSGVAFSVEYGERWIWVDRGDPAGSNRVAILNTETGELIDLRETKVDFKELNHRAHYPVAWGKMHV